MSPRRRAGGATGAAVLALVLVALLTVVLLGHLFGGGSGASSGGADSAKSAKSAGTCALAGLPVQAEDTVEEIHDNGPFPDREDGETFDNREHLLPGEPAGYYREFTVPTPGSPDRGTRRVIAGGGSPGQPAVLYYTADHYASFCRLTGAG